ncbi:unnamed protein product [Bursaphelenchus xylophilus]|uniref:U6 small nuclear RNA (adenine-(43)-N(6))-methyltransferase n=1 Tax=Bursaphelenchus xylophilus TaxID=6326 RepID=A0A1I7RKA3_BURXY|nr:unnamed protein product [Bursaphelenchus xylophilus]CAG9131403.1 unnamed protein product [Bursaphelenchus xylophilus]
MTFNHLMHPRNPYKSKPPDFSKLAFEYPRFRKHCRVSTTGKVEGDFSNEEFVKVLSETLLKKDFGLDVEFMEGSLIPRVPQRLNYLLLIQDILIANGICENVMGLDIGTGASCIYPLLGARLCKFSFVATEIDEDSVKWAQKQVEKNFKNNEIILIQGQKEGFFKTPLKSVDRFDFCMCNPPFFHEKEANEKFTSDVNGNRRNSSNKHTNAPNSVTVAKTNELMVEGGEVEFVKRIMDESVQVKDKFRLFTTMLGKKSSVATLKKHLVDRGCQQFAVSILSQGRTQRWVISWTFDETVDLTAFRTTRPQKKRKAKIPLEIPSKAPKTD